MPASADPPALLALGQQLIANRRHDSPEFVQGLEHLNTAARTGLIEAQLTLGHVYAQMPVLTDANRLCAYWYRQAAEQRNALAQDRLADQYLLGRGVPADDALAFHWLSQAATQGHPHALCSLGYLHDTAIGTEFDPVAATDLYLLATAQADPRGLFNLGLRYRDGRGAPQHPAWALACFSLAAFARYPLAEECAQGLRAAMATEMQETATGMEKRLRNSLRGFQARLKETPDLLNDPAALLAFARENLRALNDSTLSFSTDTPGRAGEKSVEKPHRARAAQTLSDTPHIFTIDEFVSESECAQLLAAASQDLQAATHVQDRLSGEQTAFTGTIAMFSTTDYDVVMRNVERRIGACFDVSAAKVELLSILRYRAGNRYSPHVDYFDAARLAYNRSVGDLSGQRIASFLVYLRAPQQGGETRYLKPGLDVAGRPRMALCHWNLTRDGSPDPLTLHTGVPVIEGEKWLARTTIREKNLY